jgi:hypothetical protein
MSGPSEVKAYCNVSPKRSLRADLIPCLLLTVLPGMLITMLLIGTLRRSAAEQRHDLSGGTRRPGGLGVITPDPVAMPIC